MYIIDGEVDVMMNQQTVILKPGDVFLIDSRLPHSTKSVHGNHAVLIQLPYEFSKNISPMSIPLFLVLTATLIMPFYAPKLIL